MTKEKECVGRFFDCSSQETATKSCNPVPEYTGIGKKKWCRMVASPERWAWLPISGASIQ